MKDCFYKHCQQVSLDFWGILFQLQKKKNIRGYTFNNYIASMYNDAVYAYLGLMYLIIIFV